LRNIIISNFNGVLLSSIHNKYSIIYKHTSRGNILFPKGEHLFYSGYILLGTFDPGAFTRVTRLITGCASPVLTATHHSYGSLAWLSDLFFFRPTSGGQTPQPILTQNGSNDVHSRKDVPFAVKVATFHTPW